MKRTLFLILLAISANVECQIFQNCNPTRVIGIGEAKGISTNPANPINDERPCKKNTFFDWRSEFYNVNSSSIAATQIKSPFFQNDNGNVSHFFENKDMKPEDGWELIKYDMGFNESGAAKNPATDYVYLVLYNKYTSILRVFLAGTSQSYNGARIIVKFDSQNEKYSSILSNASKLFPLDKFEPNPQIGSFTNFINGLANWFYADFQMSYDPCTCYFESRLIVNVSLISTATINLKGTITGTIEPIANLSPGAGQVNQQGFSFKDLVPPDLYSIGSKTQKSFKSYQEYVSSIEKTLGIQNQSTSQLTPFQASVRDAVNQLKNDLASSSFLKTGLKSLPYIGTALDLVNFFTGGGRSENSSVTLTPMAINASLSLSGNLTTANPYRDIIFYTPGSKNSQNKDPERYPYYNEVLGVFNLLTSPKIIFKATPNGAPGTYNFQLFTPNSSEIEYSINPAAGFNLTSSEILANIRFRGNGLDDQTGFLPITAINDFNTQFSATAAPFWAELEILLNLSRNGNQNVLIKYTYQLDWEQNQTFAYASTTLISRPSSNRDLVILNPNFSGSASAWNSVTIQEGSVMKPNSSIQTTASQFFNQSLVPAPVSTARINEFCNSSVYKDNASRNPAARLASNNEESEEDAKNIEKNFIAFPNPAADKVSFRYYIQEPAQVRLHLINTTGTLIATPVDAYQEAGSYEFAYDASNLPSGIYIYTLETSKGKQTKRLVIIK
ncbi:MAG: T9SS type A sorting domain-containing protein [Cyclobacteriaceae bacterium]